MRHRPDFALPGLVLAFNHRVLQHLAAAKQWLPADLQRCKVLHLIRQACAQLSCLQRRAHAFEQTMLLMLWVWLLLGV